MTTTTTNRAALAERLRERARQSNDGTLRGPAMLAADLIEQDGRRIAELEAELKAELKALRFDLNVAATEAYNEGYAAARAALDFTAPDS